MDSGVTVAAVRFQVSSHRPLHYFLTLNNSTEGNVTDIKRSTLSCQSQLEACHHFDTLWLRHADSPSRRLEAMRRAI